MKTDTTFITVVATVVASLSSGGLVAAINHWSNKKKSEAEARKTRNDIVQENIETALKLRDKAIEEYVTVEGKLKQARALLDEVQHELDIAKHYIHTLTDILDENGIPYPEYPGNSGLIEGGLYGYQRQTTED